MNIRGLVLLFLCVPVLAQETLPGTAPLSMTGDLAAAMVNGIHRFLDRETAAAPQNRARFWHRDYSSPGAYAKIGRGKSRAAADHHRRGRCARPFRRRQPARRHECGFGDCQGAGLPYPCRRWPVFDGVTMEGLMLEPEGAPVARVVAIPDADWSPEMLAGLALGIPPGAQFARRLAENGCLVLVPTIINREDTWSGIPGIRMTNQPHREWIYRMAFEAGRQIVGYEVQAVLAAVDWFDRENAKDTRPHRRCGYGEGGLSAFYSAALDSRIDAALVSGYFQPREELWKEPIYREIWSLVREFGEADIASLIAPRALVVEYCRFPVVSGPPPQTNQRRGATPNGTITTPPADAVRGEVEKARLDFERLGAADRLTLVEGGAEAQPGSDKALAALLRAVGAKRPLRAAGALPQRAHSGPNIEDRMHRQFDAWVNYTQRLIRESPKRRQEFWAKFDTSTPERWKQTSDFYRDYIWDQIIGRLPAPTLPMNPRSRLIYDTPKFRGYEVVLDVWPDVFAYGILLLPKDLKPGERRPVVVCQHGLEGRPQDVADPNIDNPYYHHYRGEPGGAGIRRVRAAEPVHRPGPLSAAAAQGPSPQVVAILLYPGSARAHPGMAQVAAVRRPATHRLLWPFLRRENRGAGPAPARRLCALDLCGRLQRMGLEDHQHRVVVFVHAAAGVRHAGVRLCEQGKLLGPLESDGPPSLHGGKGASRHRGAGRVGGLRVCQDPPLLLANED